MITTAKLALFLRKYALSIAECALCVGAYESLSFVGLLPVWAVWR